MARLDEIEARAKAASDGPWVEDDGWVHSEPQNRACMEWIRKKLAGKTPSKPRPVTAVARCEQDWPDFQENADFIAAARTDVPALCRALREALKGLRLACPFRPVGKLGCLRNDCQICGSAELALAELSK